MATITDLKNFLATYAGRTAIADLIPSNLSPAGINVDLGLMAANSAALYAQKMHDFKACEANGFISVPSTGGNTGAANTVFPVVGLTGTALNVKRIDSVSLPLAGGEYLPIEFMESDAFVARVRMQVGRRLFDASKTLAQLGFSTSNPIAYLNGTTLFLYPTIATTTVQINVTRFLPEYTTGTDSDFLTTTGFDYLKWAALLELNFLFKVFIPKQETSIDESLVSGMRDAALAALAEYDRSTSLGTSTPQRAPAG